ncbi:sensor histidine kinase [Gilvimarinus sp. 1_MG-2023]|uniref:sensor histidine kinase n=1 Tax=Gilvimarinus sp. 1_MG-2023 TaxID=3062638 RepID=UPI0026E234E8|nr:ATP-binding protein [Gilvimarinus sp. 1_MG-2023]MDO6748211.1 ATP-binding protein [Gilvimarinus sp. 1_MG-2023]
MVTAGQVAGTISRYAIMRIFLQSYGREIYGSRPVGDFMNKEPLLIDINTDIEEASRYVHAHIDNPITEDFVIITGENQYYGMGMVLSLLELLEKRAEIRNRALQTANHRLKSSQAHLIQSEKMASLGQMVAGVAHEINTPLGYVQSNVELAASLQEHIEQLTQSNQALVAALLADEPNDETITQAISVNAASINETVDQGMIEDLRTLVADSLHGLDQIGELVGNLKNFARIDHIKMSEVDLNDCIDSALNIGRNIIKQKAQVIKDYQDGTVIECVSSQINQVLLNILTNAAQAIDNWGKIKVKTRVRNDCVDIHILDNGRGMPEAVRKKIFDPFFTTKKVGEGTGLGLSISYQIIQQHKGVINVRSVEGKGTEFVIRLPKTQSSQSTEEPI